MSEGVEITQDEWEERLFNRLSWETCHRIDVLTLNKLKFAFPTNEDDAETVKRCVCMIINELQKVEQIKESAISGMD